VAAKNFHATNEKSSHGVKGPRFFSGALGGREAGGEVKQKISQVSGSRKRWEGIEF